MTGGGVGAEADGVGADIKFSETLVDSVPMGIAITCVFGTVYKSIPWNATEIAPAMTYRFVFTESPKAKCYFILLL